jgi:hypothetical protein
MSSLRGDTMQLEIQDVTQRALFASKSGSADILVECIVQIVGLLSHPRAVAKLTPANATFREHDNEKRQAAEQTQLRAALLQLLSGLDL